MRYLNEIELHSNIRRQAVSSPIGRASHAGTGEQLRGPEVTGAAGRMPLMRWCPRQDSRRPTKTRHGNMRRPVSPGKCTQLHRQHYKWRHGAVHIYMDYHPTNRNPSNARGSHTDIHVHAGRHVCYKPDCCR